jgi:ketosteroid isomerase-like protein
VTEHQNQNPEDPQERDENIRTLLAVNRRFYEAFERLDGSIMSSVWAHNEVVSCMHPSPGWALLRGWDEVRQSWEQIFSRLRTIRFKISNTRMVLAGNLAWVILTERLRAYAYDSEEEILESTVATNLFERSGATWRMLHHHATLLLDDHPPEEMMSDAAEAFKDTPLAPNARDTIKRLRAQQQESE